MVAHRSPKPLVWVQILEDLPKNIVSWGSGLTQCPAKTPVEKSAHPFESDTHCQHESVQVKIYALSPFSFSFFKYLMWGNPPKLKRSLIGKAPCMKLM